jgi:ABC-type multidrug transport system fused ATPase/permease subunit
MVPYEAALGILPLLTADLSQVPQTAPFEFSLVFLAMLIGGAIAILYYLLSKVLASPQIEAFAKEEFSQWFINLFIVILWLTVYGALGTIISIAACGGAPSCDQFSLAFFALDTVYWHMLSAYLSFLSIEFFVGFFSSVGFSLPLGTPLMAVKWIGFQPLGGLSMLSNSVVNIVESIGMLLGLVIGREQLLSLFRDLVPKFLLPFGLLLRALPFTRITGSSLIAISFAAFFIFPLSIVLSHYMMFEMQETNAYIPIVPTPTGLCELPENEKAFEDAATYLEDKNKKVGEYLLYSEDSQVTYDSFYYQFTDMISSAAEGLGAATSNIFGVTSQWFSFSTVAAFAKPTAFAYFFYYLVLNQLQASARIAVMTAVSFVLEIIITITGYRAIAAAIGGELEILGLTKVV